MGMAIGPIKGPVLPNSLLSLGLVTLIFRFNWEPQMCWDAGGVGS